MANTSYTCGGATCHFKWGWSASKQVALGVLMRRISDWRLKNQECFSEHRAWIILICKSCNSNWLQKFSEHGLKQILVLNFKLGLLQMHPDSMRIKKKLNYSRYLMTGMIHYITIHRANESWLSIKKWNALQWKFLKLKPNLLKMKFESCKVTKYLVKHLKQTQ